MLARTQKWLAIFMILLGVLSIFSLLTGRSAGALFWPAAFIFVGMLLVLRPPNILPQDLRLHFATEVDEHGDWQVESRSYVAFANEINLDMRTAQIPSGETLITASGFATEVSLILPDGVGLAVKANAFSTEASIFGDRQEHVFSGLDYTSEGYAQADKRLRFELNGFAVELNVIH